MFKHSLILLFVCSQSAVSLRIPEKPSKAPFDVPGDLQAAFNRFQHLNVWQTVDGTKPRIASLDIFPMDTWEAPAPSYDTRSYTDTATVTLVGEMNGCSGTLGSWCADWWRSKIVPRKAYQHGDRPCPHNCNGVGVCNYDIGVCQCPAGWKGIDCTQPHKRPCTDAYSSDLDPIGIPRSSIDPITKEDTNLTSPSWTRSRCTGVCDDDVGACYCGWNSTHARIPPPPGSPPGTPPVKVGRPIMEAAKADKDMAGNSIPWGRLSRDHLYGPTGWCNAEKGKETFRSACHQISSLQGPYCEVPSATYCPNQCNGRGICNGGFCKCDDNWYGTTCDKLRSGAKPQQVSPHVNKSYGWMDVWQPVNIDKNRSRQPLIYVYDLPSEYNSKMLQYRIGPSWSVWRFFSPDNTSVIENQIYAVETYLHEALLTSPHRTMNPEEADFFYVPAYISFMIWPVRGWSDGPWWGAPTVASAPMHIANMWLEVKRWIQKHFPWWDRRNGRDHIWLAPIDEGACFMPSEIYNTSIILTHWGRTESNHVSGTWWEDDNYNNPVNDFPKHQPEDHRDLYKNHPCYTAGKDLLIPAFKNLAAWSESPMQGKQPLKRDILLFFKGDVGLRKYWVYSRGIRQTLYRLAKEEGWREKYKILIGSASEFPGFYGQYLSRSKFCLVSMGAGWSGRAEDAVLHGCIPVLINDNVEPVLHGILDWDSFSIRIPQSRMAELPQILLNVTQPQLESMQQALSKVWMRFAYVTGPWFRNHLPVLYKRNQKGRKENISLAHPYRPLNRFPVRQDAFHTIIQWLASMIPYTQL